VEVLLLDVPRDLREASLHDRFAHHPRTAFHAE
jgi:hypothetical protein